MSTLEPFHPLIAQWFDDCVGRPTEVQTRAWPHIAAGEHVLMCAPTGSGKTLAAFLWALNDLITRPASIGQTRVLYVSPLRALNNDIQRNLLRPLDELGRRFAAAGQPPPALRVLTRSGDTPAGDRRRMQRRPPHILITTPESLNLLLSSDGGRSMLHDLSTVILDEIHAVAGSKRGVHLITAVDRLVTLSGEFQRIALSATVRPLETVAAFVGGFTLEGAAEQPRYRARPVVTIASTTPRRYALRVHPVPSEDRPSGTDTLWPALVERLKPLIHANRSTLVFTNSRRQCEKLTHLLNQDAERLLAYAHHGSLSREIREAVEAGLKSGRLAAIVATSSLELGIDVGTLDAVVLVQAPPAVSAAVQRIGRAGHQVDQPSRGAFMPLHQHDLLEAAVLAAAVDAQAIEPLRPVQRPLDVLAQVLVSMAAARTWDIDALFARIRASHPYRDLTRPQFDLVLDMLAGRYADSRVRALQPRLSVHRPDNSVAARPGARRHLYASGGTIPDRGYFHLRHERTNARIGELDEEFVWEARVGQSFTLGTQRWQVRRVTHNDVFVTPTRSGAAPPPFWRGEQTGRDAHFADAVARFLEHANDHLNDPAFAALLRDRHHLEPAAADQLLDYLRRQRDLSGCDLPHRHHLLVEHVSTGPGGTPGRQVVLHTCWGGRVNRPLALAMESAWEGRRGGRIDIFVADDCLVLQPLQAIAGGELLALVTSTSVRELLKQRLESSGFFAARFRECAGRALLLGRDRANQRLPLWMGRLRAQKLLAAVGDHADFPIRLEAWRSCLRDELDLEKLEIKLAELESGAIRWSEAATRVASPFARSVSWRIVDQYLYRGDQPATSGAARLSDDLLREVVFQPGRHPELPRRLIEQFELKRQRLSPGYAPATARDLVDWVRERLLLPEPEWQALMDAIRRDGHDARAVAGAAAARLVRLSVPGAAAPLVAAREDAPRIRKALYGCSTAVTPVGLDAVEPAPRAASGLEPVTEAIDTALLGQWLGFYGPRSADDIAHALGLDTARLDRALDELADARQVVRGALAGDATSAACDSENLDVLIRMRRADAVPAFEPLTLDWLAPFLARHQGLTAPAGDAAGLCTALEPLLCYPAPADQWEADILPARLRHYDPSWLDAVMGDSDLRWVGSAGRRLCFCFESDLDLLRDRAAGAGDDTSGLFPDPRARYGFDSLQQATGLGAAELGERLWSGVWRGMVSNDGFTALRRGIDSGFTVPQVHAAPTAPGQRGRFARWRTAVPYAGSWFHLRAPGDDGDRLDIEQRERDRVRVLLDRYGILFRELLQRELPAFRWGRIFRTLRLMELAGEVLAGCFFQGIPGPQFMSHAAFRDLQRGVSDDDAYWLGACDAASLCGLALPEFPGSLPRRVAGTHLACHGRRIVLVSRRLGRRLEVHLPPDDPRLPPALAVLRHLLDRRRGPLPRITIETINGGHAAASDYVDVLRTSFDVVIDYRRVLLMRRRA